jgi:glyoxylase I family protein
MSKLTSLHHLALTVTDVDRSVPFYERVLELTETTRREDPETGVRKVYLRAPGEDFHVVLVQHPDTDRVGFDRRRTGLDHIAFKVDSHDALKKWEQRLADYSVSYTPATASRTVPGACVVVFCDPDGIQLEVWAQLSD